LVDKIDEKTQPLQDKVAATVDNVKDKASDMVDKAKDLVDGEDKPEGEAKETKDV